MASKETTPSGSGSQESGSSREGASSKNSWDNLRRFTKERAGALYHGIKERLGDTALGAAVGAKVDEFKSRVGADNSRHIELTTPGSETSGDSAEDNQDQVSTSTPESRSGDSGEDDKSADSGEQDKKQKQELTEEEKWLLGQREKKVKSAEERLASVAKEHGEGSDAYKRAENDLWMQREFLREVESAFGSSADHSDKTDGDKPEQAKTTPETSTQAEENDSSDEQAESNSSAEGGQDVQDSNEQNQGQKPGSLAERIVAVRRQKVEEDQAELDSLEPGSEEYKAAQAALKKSQERLDSAMKIVNSKEGATTQEETDDDSAEKTEPMGDASTVDIADDSTKPETVDDSVEAAKKDLEKERSVVAKDLTEATQQLSEHKPGDPAYNGLLARVKGLRNRFNYISEQIKEESGIDGKHDDVGDKGDAESQETSESEDDKKDKKSPEASTPEDAVRAKIAKLEEILNDPEASKSAKYSAAYKRKLLLDGLRAKSGDDSKEGKKSPEAPTPDNDLEQKVAAARDEYAKRRAEYEQMGTFKGLFKGKELKKRMEMARAELEGFMAQLVYHQKDQERSIIKNGVEGADEEQQKEARQKAIQSIAAAVLEQHALVDEKTQEEYDKRLDERSLFKKVAAKIGRWFVGKENKDGGKLGLGGWLKSGGTGLAAGAALGIFGISVPISSVVGTASSAGVKLAAHQRALENARGEKRKLSDEELASFAGTAQGLEWTAEGQDGSDGKDQSKEAIASMVGATLAETQKDTERRQKNMVAIGSKAAMGWGLGFAAGRVAGGLIKSQMFPDQKPANIADHSSGKDAFNPENHGKLPKPDVDPSPDINVTPTTIGPDVEPWTFMAENYSPEEAMSKLYEAADALREAGHSVEFVPVSGDQLGMVVDGVSDYSTVNGLVAKALELKF